MEPSGPVQACNGIALRLPQNDYVRDVLLKEERGIICAGEFGPVRLQLANCEVKQANNTGIYAKMICKSKAVPLQTWSGP